ncbi:MAG: hypothetical protein AB7S38_40225 [Vulcanimicrobiota bacterium]
MTDELLEALLRAQCQESGGVVKLRKVEHVATAEPEADWFDVERLVEATAILPALPDGMNCLIG